MTGRDLIIYILKNGLEDKEVFKDGSFVGFLSVDDLARRFGVGKRTIEVWYELGMITGFEIGDHLYFTKDTADPRKE